MDPAMEMGSGFCVCFFNQVTTIQRMEKQHERAAAVRER
jgi:hypothetical protein